MDFNDVFGSLDIKYCIYFFYLSMFGIISSVGLLVFGLIYMKYMSIYFYYIILFFIIYFQNRLLYNMCLNNKKILESLSEVTTSMNKVDKYQTDCRMSKRPMAFNCPVCGEKPFCTSTGWTCKTMWTLDNLLLPANGHCLEPWYLEQKNAWYKKDGRDWFAGNEHRNKSWRDGSIAMIYSDA